MRNKKNIVVILIPVLLIFFSIAGYCITKTYLTNSALNYLCEKYGANKEEFELIDYECSKYFLNDDAIPRIEKGYYKWEFKYNNRNFFVNRIEKKFYDDYQLEDVEKWCVEWLQKNVDEDIYFVTVSSSDLYNCQKTKGNNLVLSRNNILEFMNSFKKQETIETDYLWVYYDNENVSSKTLNEKVRRDYNLFGISFTQEKQTARDLQIDKNELCWRHWYWFE